MEAAALHVDAMAGAAHSAALPVLLTLVTHETGSPCPRTALLLSLDHVIEAEAIQIALRTAREATPQRQIAALFNALPALGRTVRRRHPFALHRSTGNHARAN